MRINLTLVDDDPASVVFAGRVLQHILNSPSGRAWLEFGDPATHEGYGRRNLSGSYSITIHKTARAQHGARL